MSKSNKERAAQLGMPYGTAAGRLRKMLMFKFAQELGYDICYRCKETIETVAELSIEHKEPWFKQPDGNAKFWDLDNIAFSHLDCNAAHHANGGELLRITGPEGTAWCCTCKQHKQKEEFWRLTKRWNGVKAQCKACQRAYDESTERKDSFC